MNKRFLQPGIYAVLLGASLLGHVWVAGLLVFSLEADTLWHVSALIVACGLLVLAGLNLLCRRFFRLNPVPVWMDVLAGRHANALALPRPRLYQLAATGINAFALSGLGGAGIVLFHSQLLRQLTQDEIDAVIAHELAHLSERHSTVMTFLQGMSTPVVFPLALCASGVLSLLLGVHRTRGYFATSYSLLNLLCFPLTSMLIAIVSRHWEYRADAIAARLVGTDRYIAALKCLHGIFFQHPDILSMTVMTAYESRRDEWALSHPDLGKRIAALRQVP